jgi:hypothetical protein
MNIKANIVATNSWLADKIKAALAGQGKSDAFAMGSRKPKVSTNELLNRIKTRIQKVKDLTDQIKSETESPRKMCEDHKKQSDSEAQQAGKLLPVHDFEIYDEYGDVTNDQYHVFMATHPDHKNMMGQHHFLKVPVPHDKLKEYVEQKLDREVETGISQGYDRMIIHQPKVETKTQKNSLSLVKSYDIEEKDGALVYTKKSQKTEP